MSRYAFCRSSALCSGGKERKRFLELIVTIGSCRLVPRELQSGCYSYNVSYVTLEKGKRGLAGEMSGFRRCYGEKYQRRGDAEEMVTSTIDFLLTCASLEPATSRHDAVDRLHSFGLGR